MAGSQDHSILWNAAEHAGLRRNSRNHHTHLLMATREPAPIVPAKVFYAERQSQMSTAAGDGIRARYREKREYRRNRTHRKPADNRNTISN